MSDQSYIVECLLHRQGGSEVEMLKTPLHPQGATYHFKPSSSDPRHTAVVSDPTHLATLIAIHEAYRLVGPAAASARGTGRGSEGGAGVPLPASPHNQTVAVAPEPAIVERTINLAQVKLDFTLPDGSVVQVDEEQARILQAFIARSKAETTISEPDVNVEQTVVEEAPAEEAPAEPQPEKPEVAEVADQPQEPIEDGLDDLSRDELAARFEAKFNKAPARHATKATIIDRLRG